MPLLLAPDATGQTRDLNTMELSLQELIGPYEAWAHGPGAAYCAAGSRQASPWIAALGELPAGLDPRKVAVKAVRKDAAGDNASVRTGPIWEPAVDPKSGGFWPLLIHAPSSGVRSDVLPKVAEALTRLGSGTASAERKGFRLNARLPEGAVDASASVAQMAARLTVKTGRQTPRRVTPKSIIAVIDDGLPFAHANLRDRDGRTRVEYCWLQSANTALAAADRTIPYGREYTRGDIDALITAHGRNEDALYAAAGAIESGPYPGSALNRFASHGAHVLDVAAGHRHGAAMGGSDLDDIGVIAVQLPTAVTLDTTGYGKDAFVLGALHYIFERADRIAAQTGAAAPLPVMINFSYGFTGGPHNGQDRLERAIRAMVALREARAPTFLVMPAGNSFMAALYGEIRKGMAQRGSYAIPWRIQPTDRTANYLEIWLPQAASPAGVSLKMTDPSGRLRAEISGAGGGPVFVEDGPGRIIGQISLEQYASAQEPQLWRFVIALAPTDPENQALPACISGKWRITLSGLGAVLDLGPVACRIQRDNDPFGHTRGARQSYFDDPADERFLTSGDRPEGENPSGAFVRRSGTLNGLATHDRVTVVAGLDASSQRPSWYSSCGAGAQGEWSPGQVHLAAIADGSRASPGIRAAATRSGATVRIDGTSVASPQIARAAAQTLAAAGTIPLSSQPAPQRLANLIASQLSSVQPADRKRLGKAVLKV
jgi:hypothetical protein